MAKTLGPVALKLRDEVLVRVQEQTPVSELLEQLAKAYQGGRIQDREGYEVTMCYSQDLPGGEYAIKQPTDGRAKTLGPVTLKLGDEVLHTPVTALLNQLNMAYTGSRIQDLQGFDVTVQYSQDLPGGEYAIKHPITAVGMTDALRIVAKAIARGIEARRQTGVTRDDQLRRSYSTV